jgi:mannitol/fructose-specific phosphotransferase system IIA component (Ntr-type)
MKITDLLSEKTISTKVVAASKEDVIKQAVELISHSGAISDVATYEKASSKGKRNPPPASGKASPSPTANPMW